MAETPQGEPVAVAVIGPAGVGNADAMAPRVLSLPQYPTLPLEAVDRACETLRAALGA